MEAAEQIKRFTEFLEKEYYAELLEKTRKGEKFLIIDFKKLIQHDPDLADKLLDEPEELIRAGELAIEQITDNSKGFSLRIKNLPEIVKIMIRDIRSVNLRKFLYVEGVVRRKSEVRPQVTSARFECPSCGNTISVLQLDKNFKEPTRCSCGRKGKFKLLSKELVDAQGLVLEEVPEQLEGGEQPKRIDVFLKNDLVSPLTEKKTNPGSKLLVAGVIKEVPKISRTGGQSTQFDIILEANYVEPLEEDYSDLTINEEELKKIKELSRDPMFMKKLVGSIVPTIFGHDRTKESLLLQMVGGVRKIRDDGSVTRGDIHILLVGDPGSGKSMMLKRISKVSPKGRFISGKGVSGAGLTATVVRDEFIQGWSLEAGALVLANKGICCIDEMDKMTNEDRSAMHEALEGQQITISKANIQACYSDDTEVLTDKGWKRYYEVKEAKIAQYNIKDNSIKFLPHKGLYVYNYNNKMYHFKNKRIDILVTPDHKMLAKERSQKAFRIIKAKDINYSLTKFKNAGNYNIKEKIKFFILPKIDHKQKRKHPKYIHQHKPKNIPINLWLEFIGYYVTEGGIQKEPTIGIVQKKGSKANKIKICLLKLAKYVGFTLSKTIDNNKYIRFQITNTQLFRYLEKNCGKKHVEKKVPLNISLLSKRQLLILYNAMMLGDGSSDGKSFSSTSKNLIETFQAITCLIGKSASQHIQYEAKTRGNRVRLYRVVISKYIEQYIKREKIKKIKYKRKVYCFSTKTGFFITRRNGKISIQGNTLRCETTVLAAANPKFGRFDPYDTVAAQINLPPTLINRFDLIFPIKDLPNQATDEKMAQFILELHRDPEIQKTEIDTELLRKYLAYARQNIFPKLTDTALEELKDYYIKMRSSSAGSGSKSVPISARQLEGLIRLSEASARLRLSEKVTSKDAKKAIELLDYCLRQVAFDEETGTIDIDRIATDMPATQRNKIIHIKEIIVELENKLGKTIPLEDVVKEARNKGIEEYEVEEIIQKLKRSGDVFEPRRGFISRI